MPTSTASMKNEKLEVFDLGKRHRSILGLLPTTEEIEQIFDELWPLCRSITGQGLRHSFAILQKVIPLELLEVPTGTKAFDWTVPEEWNIEEAWIEHLESGMRFADFSTNNLHVLGYSQPVDQVIDLEELQNFLYSLPAQPEAIPYLTSYYKKRWGFCLSEKDRSRLPGGKYRAYIRAKHHQGSLTLGHTLLPSKNTKQNKEIFFSSYLCHPSMANNELSGPITVAFLYRALSQIPNRKYNYRFVIAPETIGSLCYLSKFGSELREKMHAGFVVTCCGDKHKWTYKSSRRQETEGDEIAKQTLTTSGVQWEHVNFSPFMGADERQFCSPGFNLPVGSLMRSMYATYPEYHTSLDNKNFIDFEALRQSIEMYLKIVTGLEENEYYFNEVGFGEPMLSPRGLFPSLGSQKEIDQTIEAMSWLLNYSDGKHNLLAISKKSGFSLLELADIADTLKNHKLLRLHET